MLNEQPMTDSTPSELSHAHAAAVNRRRRMVVQFDAHDQTLGADIDKWIAYRFNYMDMPGSQIDSVWWDIGFGGSMAVWPSKVRPRARHAGLEKWWAQGIDWVQVLVDECKKRNIETFWHHRISEVDVAPDGKLSMELQNPIKAAHPDWVIRSWWWQGLWNLANPEVWDYIIAELQEVAANYDFDGMQLDFARHMPCLPPGHQWELRGQATEFVRRVRLMLLDAEKKRGRPFLLAAKVPETLEGCRVDGLDVATWADLGLVDIFSLGSRTMDVDIAAFRRITAGRNIKLQPCFDDHHTTDGYRYAPIEYLRGIFGNWWQQGADAVETFNWFSCPAVMCAEMGVPAGPDSHRQAYLECGTPESMRGRDKVFVVERRGGYPWSEGYFNHNDGAPLPTMLMNDGRVSTFNVDVCDALNVLADEISSVELSVVLFNAAPGDEIEARLNGVVLGSPVVDAQWKDPQIFSPKPQPASGGSGEYKIDPAQKLIRWAWAVPPRVCHVGANCLELRVTKRVPYAVKWPECNMVVEKVELAVRYATSAQA